MQRRPVYVIAHRCNDVFTAAAAAPRAFECDVQSNDGRTWWLDHDGIFPWSTPLDDRWLNSLGRPVLIELDMKTPAAMPIDSLLSSVRQKLAADETRLLVTCQERVPDHYARAASAYAAEIKVTAPLTFALPPKTWIAYGASTLVMPFERVNIDRQLHAAAKRWPDSPRAVWTLDSIELVRHFFALGVDSVTVDRSLVADALAYVRATPSLMVTAAALSAPSST